MSFVKCQNCGEDVSTGAEFCMFCGKPMEKPVIQKIQEPFRSNLTLPEGFVPVTLQLDCNACKTSGSMTATKVPRFSGVVRVIGGIILIPSFLGIGFALLIFFSTIMASASMPTRGDSAAQAGSAIGFGIGFMFSIFVGVISLVAGVVGWLFLLNRNVWKCLRCGFILDRA